MRPDWHPQTSLIITGSKDHLIKIWDAKSGTNIATLHSHKSGISRVRCHWNGNLFMSASRDQLVRVLRAAAPPRRRAAAPPRRRAAAPPRAH